MCRPNTLVPKSRLITGLKPLPDKRSGRPSPMSTPSTLKSTARLRPIFKLWTTSSGRTNGRTYVAVMVRGKQGLRLLPPPCVLCKEAAGIEQGPKLSENPGSSHHNGAESGALGTRDAPLDLELADVVDAWPRLPDSIKAGILAMIRACPVTWAGDMPMPADRGRDAALGS